MPHIYWWCPCHFSMAPIECFQAEALQMGIVAAKGQPQTSAKCTSSCDLIWHPEWVQDFCEAAEWDGWWTGGWWSKWALQYRVSLSLYVYKGAYGYLGLICPTPPPWGPPLIYMAIYGRIWLYKLIYTLKYVFGCLGMYLVCLNLYFECLNLYLGCLNLYLCVWTCILGVWTCILVYGFVFLVYGFVLLVYGSLFLILEGYRNRDRGRDRDQDTLGGPGWGDTPRWG